MVPIRRFLGLDGPCRRLVLEAIGCLAVAYGLVRWLPLRRYASSFGEAARHPDHRSLEARPAAIAAEVSAAIRVVSAHLPWHSTCLMNAAAAQWMLKRRGIPATLRLGLARDEASGRLLAHAWLTVGQTVLAGGPSGEHYTVVSEFRSDG
jgi:hypothetical protein